MVLSAEDKFRNAKHVDNILHALHSLIQFILFCFMRNSNWPWNLIQLILHYENYLLQGWVTVSKYLFIYLPSRQPFVKGERKTKGRWVSSCNISIQLRYYHYSAEITWNIHTSLVKRFHKTYKKSRKYVRLVFKNI